MGFEFKCISCGETHEGMPSLVAPAPASYFSIPADDRELRCVLGSDDCIIDNKWFFVKGLIEIPVIGEEELFSWGVWVSLSENSYSQWREVFDIDRRSHVGPFFGWLNSVLSPYPSTLNMKTQVHLRDLGIRPYVELDTSDHPLAAEQRQGITVDRVAELYALAVHGIDSGT